MAKESLLTHRKFAHLKAMLREPAVLVLGRMEMLYLTAHAAANPTWHSGEELEACAEWTGESGALVAALVKARLCDRADDGTLTLHDYWDHAPRYVTQRRDRQTAPECAEPRRTAPDGARKPPTDTDTDSFPKIGSNRGEPRSERGGPPKAIGDLLAGFTVSGQEQSIHGWTSQQCLNRIVKLDTSGDEATRRKRWKKRIAEVEAKPGGAAFLRKLLVYVKAAMTQERKDCGPRLNKPGAFLNQQTLAWCRGVKTEIV